MNDIAHLTTFATLLVLIAAISQPLARWLHLPHPAVMILLGTATAYGVTLGLGVDTGLRASSFHDLVVFVFLPILIFDAAFRLPVRELNAEWPTILLLAFVGLAATTLISGALIYWGIDHASGFPWIAALLTGSLLSATDPHAVLGELRARGAARVATALEGEGLFSDAATVVLFSLCLTVALGSGELTETDTGFIATSIAFLTTFAGGLLVGLPLGWLAGTLLQAGRTPSGQATQAGQAALTLISAYGSYLLAERVFGVSGVMACLACGLVLARARPKLSSDAQAGLDACWRLLMFLAGGCIYVLVGATVTLSMFRDRWLAMLIAIGAVILARVICVRLGLSLLNLVSARGWTPRDQWALTAGGLRGAVTLALALALPTELDYWWTIQSMAFGVVLFSLLIQAPLAPFLLQKPARQPPG